MTSNWNDAQEWERQWWGSCQNTYGEEEKQLLYANRMGLRPHHDGRSPYNFDLNGRSVLDIGGGPVSLLLKCTNYAEAFVADPCEYPEWVDMRYKAAGIEYGRIPGESIRVTGYDEVWLYNVLQHTQDPEKIIRNAQRAGRIIRIFEWIETRISINEGHPHSFTEAQFNDWLGGEGKVETLNGQANCWGKCYYGIFPT
ncbi:MAG: hypothetical protein KDK05_00500 [Candidatus Competibacteraceae bacterium]|nr:hypothetical protein [Anaerolineales bacterium]MCB1713597.1 hypothetical protein [Candidatus Competibacteraceae bacterium]